jgi:hypothetical protein
LQRHQPKVSMLQSTRGRSSRNINHSICSIRVSDIHATQTGQECMTKEALVNSHVEFNLKDSFASRDSIHPGLRIKSRTPDWSRSCYFEKQPATKGKRACPESPDLGLLTLQPKMLRPQLFSEERNFGQRSWLNLILRARNLTSNHT